MSRTEAKRRFTIADHIAATAAVECRKDAEVIDETPRRPAENELHRLAVRSTSGSLSVIQQVKPRIPACACACGSLARGIDF
jgi:hypothetical protein